MGRHGNAWLHGLNYNSLKKAYTWLDFLSATSPLVGMRELTDLLSVQLSFVHHCPVHIVDCLVPVEAESALRGGPTGLLQGRSCSRCAGRGDPIWGVRVAGDAGGSSRGSGSGEIVHAE